jgi:hypothetical protein
MAVPYYNPDPTIDSKFPRPRPLKKGTAANIAAATTFLVEGELLYATDTKQVYACDGTNKLRVPTCDTAGNIKVTDVGGGLYVKEGTNATMGQGTLAAGTLVVSTTKVTASSRIFLTCEGGTVTNLGTLYISSRTASTSFTVSSTNVLDTCTFSWVLIEPA